MPPRNVTSSIRQKNEDSGAGDGGWEKKTTSGEGPLTPGHSPLNPRVFSANGLHFKNKKRGPIPFVARKQSSRKQTFSPPSAPR